MLSVRIVYVLSSLQLAGLFLYKREMEGCGSNETMNQHKGTPPGVALAERRLGRWDKKRPTFQMLAFIR
jgi:hypothetical protein